MKSTIKQLKDRGKAAPEDITALSGLPLEGLLSKLHSSDPEVRSAAAENLAPFVEQAADELLKQLTVEKCLYTRLAICGCLERGGPEVAEKMAAYLGKIGSNQHRALPQKVSAKKSFPLPRDIIARSMGKMDSAVFPVLLQVLEQGSFLQICEVLDAIGYMAFYQTALATEKNGEKVIARALKWKEQEMVRWKLALCLSAFPGRETEQFLLKLTKERSLIGQEAERSLRIREQRKR